MRLRLRHRRGADGRRLHRVDGDRHRGRHDQPPRPARRREDPAAEQHPRRLRGQLSRRHRLRRLVPVEPRAAAAEGRPEGREPKLEAASSGRRGVQRRQAVRLPRVGRAGLPDRRRAGWQDAWRISRESFAPGRASSSSESGAAARIVDAPRTCCSAGGDVVALAAPPDVLRRRSSHRRRDRGQRARSTSPGRAGRRRHQPEARRAHPRRARRARHGRGVALHAARARGRGDSLRAGDRRRIAATSCACPAPRATSSASARRSATSSGPRSETDVVFVGLGIVIGGLVGLLSVTVGGLPLSLTASGGALVMGLVFGWLRSVRPTFGRIPEPALWVFDTIGLAVFIGVVGLCAGPSFVSGLQQTGPSLLFVGFIVAVTPHIAALLFGRYVLKMNPVILLGACAGAGTVTAALRSIQDEAAEQAPRPRLHRAVRDRQHSPDRMGTRHRHAHEIGGLSCCAIASLAPSRPSSSSAAAAASRNRPRLAAQAGPLPNIVVLATGGTIAGAAAERRPGRLQVRPGRRRAADQRRAAGEEARATSTASRSRTSAAQDMNDEVWLKLARRVNELLAMPDVDGIVITHGTDTMEETAYFLNLVLKCDKPVVLTSAHAARRRPCRADGPLNLYNAVAVAANKDAAGRGVLVVVNDWIHGASSLTKTNTTAVQTFLSPLSGPDRHRRVRGGRVLPRPGRPQHDRLRVLARRRHERCRAWTSSWRTRTWTAR